ncbi:MAG: hypothetical protein KIT84_24745 [Labilithrix sp.]|nr:hypothetical protein [Labilithrix sp.]MCW5814259.1 hypothetical protein [Labilithrix sp.]
MVQRPALVVLAIGLVHCVGEDLRPTAVVVLDGGASSSSSSSGGSSGSSSSSSSGSSSSSSSSGGGADASGTGSPLPAGGLYAFVSSSRHTGALGGAAGADKICGDLGQTLRRSGTFRAWISTSERKAYEWVPAEKTWYSATGVEVATSAGLTSNPSSLRSELTLDESGAAATGPTAWTGTNGSGSVGETCNGFESKESGRKASAGKLGHVDYNWTNAGTVECSTEQHLLCFEVP